MARIAAIVEHKDASPTERAIREINSGIYAFDLAPLFAALARDRLGERAGRVLPARPREDLPRARADGRNGDGCDDPREILGVNSRKELADVATILKTAKNDELMAAGVTSSIRRPTYIDPDVDVGADTIIHPGVFLEGRTRIGSRLRDPLRRPHRRTRRSTTASSSTTSA